MIMHDRIAQEFPGSVISLEMINGAPVILITELIINVDRISHEFPGSVIT